MKTFRFLASLALLTPLAYAQQPAQPAPPRADPPAVNPAPPRPRAGAPLRTPARPHTLPAQELSQAILFKLLLAEVAMQRGQNNVAIQSYLELARETRDPRIAQRATEIAWNARAMGVAVEAAGIWLAADPESQQARQVVAALLVNQARLGDAAVHLEKSLAADPGNIAQNLLQLGTLLARHPDKAAALALTQKLAQPYANLPEAHYSIAQAAAQAGDFQLALAETREAMKLKPEWEQAALFQGQLLQRTSNTDALAYYREYLQKYPKAMDVRLNYARLLVADKKFPEARNEFQSLLREFPANPDVTVAVGLLSLQLNDFDAAEKQLLRALEIDYKDPDTVRFYLGQANEDRKRFDEALKWYSSITGGEQYIPSRARYASILAKQGKLAEGRKYLQDSAGTPQQLVQFIQAEAQLLRDANDYRGAFDVLGGAVAKNPSSPDLLYDHAMAAEKIDRLDVLESNLRKVIKIKPDYAHAYNALGYSLADRNVRLPEAHALIEQALKLAPEDPFIMDSMGWVLYRMGKTDQAVPMLKRAFELRPDAEIAAHLGEVLWAAGQTDEARRVWASALKDHPANEVLLATVKKFSN